MSDFISGFIHEPFPELSALHKQVGELEQDVTKLTLLVKRLQSDLFDHPWKKSGHPWNQVRNPRHLPR